MIYFTTLQKVMSRVVQDLSDVCASESHRQTLVECAQVQTTEMHTHIIVKDMACTYTLIYSAITGQHMATHTKPH